MSSLPDSHNPLAPPAFVFDIDGVLIRGKHVLEAAKKAVEKLTDNGGESWKYPACFVTNGGGVTEERKAQQLSKWLNANITAEQIILSHTPMKDLVPRLGQVPVLVSGRGQVAEVAASYGFTQAFTTEQLGRAVPTATPFIKYAGEASAATCPISGRQVGTAQNPFRAVLVMYDPSDWYRDLQLITDVITSNGAPLESGDVQGSTPELFFSNPDLLWANEFHRPRFGQGAFACALEALHREMTGKCLPNVHRFGKPNPEPYRLAERLLTAQAKQMGWDVGDASTDGSSAARLPFSAIYGIGDNPASDIRGANAAGSHWVSVLVRTGVFCLPDGRNDPGDPAKLVVDDVLAAVDAILHRSRHMRWHSLR